MGDIFFLRHSHFGVNFNQYGFEPLTSMMHTVRKSGWNGKTLDVHGNLANWEGAMRPCGDNGYIALAATPKGSACFRITNEGEISHWTILEEKIVGANADGDVIFHQNEP